MVTSSASATYCASPAFKRSSSHCVDRSKCRSCFKRRMSTVTGLSICRRIRVKLLVRKEPWLEPVTPPGALPSLHALLWSISRSATTRVKGGPCEARTQRTRRDDIRTVSGAQASENVTPPCRRSARRHADHFHANHRLTAGLSPDRVKVATWSNVNFRSRSASLGLTSTMWPPPVSADIACSQSRSMI